MAAYDRIESAFEERGCKLLTTYDEYMKIKSDKNCNYKFRYIASCGHEHIVFYNVFKSRGTGVICPSCQRSNQAKISKEIAAEKPLANVKQEKDCIDYLIELTTGSFICKKLFDGCKADVALKPIDVESDEWIGLQFKTTKSMYKDNYYSFHLLKDYEDLYIFCMSLEEKKMWVFPYDEVKGKVKIAIGSTKSKYDKYELKDTNSQLKTYYDQGKKFTFDVLNTPTNIYQQREQEYRKFREKQVDFITFEYPNIEGTVYDFKVGNLKIQEKVGGKHQHKFAHMFHLCKNDGRVANQRTQSCYAAGDNDIYWLNNDDKATFYVIPEKELIDREYVGRTDKKKKAIVLVNNDENNSWYQKFKFSYETIKADENEKLRLKKLLCV